MATMITQGVAPYVPGDQEKKKEDAQAQVQKAQKAHEAQPQVVRWLKLPKEKSEQNATTG